MSSSIVPTRLGTDGYAHPEILVETDWLERHLDDPGLRIIDCTAYPAPNPDPERRKKFPIAPQSGRAHFDEEHIPGAGFIDVPGELADSKSELPMMMPPDNQFVEAISAVGIGDDTRVVLYSATSPMWAARVWWMLRSFGFENAAVLNGGWSKWIGEGRPVSAEPCAYPPGEFTGRARAGSFLSREEVFTAIGDDGVRLIHALTPSVYDGTNDTLIFGRRGHIRGSVNVPSGTLHDPDTGAYLPAAGLRERFDAVRAGEADKIITYCGGGVNACDNALALCLLGYRNVSVYDGSMSEWGNDPSLPLETGWPD